MMRHQYAAYPEHKADHERLLDDIRDALRHRGPDGEGQTPFCSEMSGLMSDFSFGAGVRRLQCLPTAAGVWILPFGRRIAVHAHSHATLHRSARDGATLPDGVASSGAASGKRTSDTIGVSLELSGPVNGAARRHSPPLSAYLC